MRPRKALVVLGTNDENPQAELPDCVAASGSSLVVEGALIDVSWSVRHDEVNSVPTSEICRARDTGSRIIHRHWLPYLSELSIDEMMARLEWRTTALDSAPVRCIHLEGRSYATKLWHLMGALKLWVLAAGNPPTILIELEKPHPSLLIAAIAAEDRCRAGPPC